MDNYLYINSLTQFLTVISGNTAAVYDPDVVSNRGRNRRGEVRANVYVCLLCLSRSCNLSGTNSPDWLISNHDLAEQQ